MGPGGRKDKAMSDSAILWAAFFISGSLSMIGWVLDTRLRKIAEEIGRSRESALLETRIKLGWENNND